MLTFFRRIRKGLLGSDQARKYLLYALGEILLVMIGILLALEVNNSFLPVDFVQPLTPLGDFIGAAPLCDAGREYLPGVLEGYRPILKKNRGYWYNQSGLFCRKSSHGMETAHHSLRRCICGRNGRQDPIGHDAVRRRQGSEQVDGIPGLRVRTGIDQRHRRAGRYPSGAVHQRG